MCKHDYLESKPPLTIDEQADLLISRGLIGDKEQIHHALTIMSYYHFSGFIYQFYKKDENGFITERFKEGTAISHILRRYEFDLELRHLVFKAIDRIETYLRRIWIEYTSLNFDAFYYSNSENYKNWSEHKNTIESIENKAKFRQQHKHKEPFISHYEEFYKEAHLPIWMAAEFMDFGDLTYFIKYSNKAVKNSIAKNIGLPSIVLDSFLRSLNTLRNACAHHMRIWDRTWGTRPMLPNRICDIHWYAYYHVKWRLPRFEHIKQSCGSIETSHIGFLLFICRYLLNIISPECEWHISMNDLFNRYVVTPEELRMMGLPIQWNSHPLWQDGK